MTFADLGINDSCVEALSAAGITHPFPIQRQAIPIAIKGTDLIGQARTGTGKTLAFGLPILEQLTLPAPDSRPQALIMCPTRELALQVSDSLSIASATMGVSVLTVYGGVGYEPQLDQLDKGVNIVVGTPGRLLDLANRQKLDLSGVRFLVLDEADEMLDLGFLPDVEKLIARTPTDRQTMLFSATMPTAIMTLARTHLNQPINIRAESSVEQATVPETTQFVYQAHDLDKPAIVGKLLQNDDASRVMIFCSTKRDVQRLTDDLKDRGFSATCIHGDLSQAVRERSLNRFRDGKAHVIVCTDVAARGIDVDNVTHVINYDCPDDEKTYVHRIGRTGRAGRTGVAVTLVEWKDIPRWKTINRALDLDFADPMEAYSTTPELLADLGIPEGATGRLKDPAPRETSERSRDSSERPRGGRGGRSQSHRSDSRAERPRKSGQRQRRRNGVVVRERTDDVTASGNGPQGEASPVSPQTSSGDASANERTTPRRRRRRRNPSRPSPAE
ncbi:MAG: DEAD/DEAH box helicase [Propionibacteriaceae bacterium]|nr:DEAD/DEAH box helicase [Propionibacteriaceae bacterium]